MHVDAEILEVVEDTLRVFDSLPNRAGEDPAVLAECLDRYLRHRVDRMRSDERLDVTDGIVERVLGARTRPQQSLRAGSGLDQGTPFVSVEHRFEAAVCEACAGDRRSAEERGGTFGVGRPTVDALRQKAVHQDIDAAQEKAGHGGYRSQRSPGLPSTSEGVEVCAMNRLVGRDGEQQCNVDVDAVVEKLLDGRNTRGRARNLHHEVRPIHGSPEPLRLLDRAIGVVHQVGRDFEADVAVHAVRRLPDRPKHVAGLTDVRDRELLVDLRDREAFSCERFDLVRIQRSAGDRLVKDRRIRCHAS